MRKPQRLRIGDKVAVVATSTNLRDHFPAVYNAGLRTLVELGLRVVEFPTARMTAAELHNNPVARANDLNNAFADNEIKMIANVIDGDDSVRILPFLDADTALNNPKILLGYSDNSVLSLFYAQHNVPSFHGPTLMAGLAQLRNAEPKAVQHLRDLLFEANAVHFMAFDNWCNGYPDWTQPHKADRLGELLPHDTWHWLQRSKAVRGRLLGGSVDAFEFVKGTDYWPSREHFSDTLFFLETSEEKPSVTTVKRWLRNYGMQGVFDSINALLIGRARDYTNDEKLALDNAILEIVRDEFGCADLTVVTNMDFGHTDPQWILPIGCEAILDPESETFRLVEPAVE